MTRIRIEYIAKRYAAQQVLGGLSLAIEPGELFVLLGESGCGKSTLLKIIAGLETPDDGAVYFNDTNVLPVPPEKRGSVYLFQESLLFPFLNVRDNIAFGLKMRKVSLPERKTRVEAMLEKIGLGGLGRRMPSELSGGQAQRVSLARALVLQPQVLLLDEPLSNLDTSLREEMRKLIRMIHDEMKITTVFVTHDQMEAAVMGDRIGVMIAGAIEQAGTPYEIFRTPKTERIAAFMKQTLFEEFTAKIAPKG